MSPCCSTLSEAELCEIAAAWENATCCEGEPGYGRAKDFSWSYDPSFPVANFGDPKKWIEWYAEEKQGWADEGQPNRYGGVETWWATSPEDEPLIVVEGTDGKWYPWDGNHRIGISCTTGTPTVPVIVGRRPVSI